MKNLIKGGVSVVVCSFAAGAGASAGTWIRTAENSVSTSHVTKNGYFDGTKANEISYQEDTNGNMWVIAQNKTTTTNWNLELNGQDTGINQAKIVAGTIDRAHLSILPCNGSGVIIGSKDDTNLSFWSIFKKTDGTWDAVKIGADIAVTTLAATSQNLDDFGFWAVGNKGYLAYYAGTAGSNAISFTVEGYDLPNGDTTTITRTAVNMAAGPAAPTGTNIYRGFLSSNTNRGFVTSISLTSNTWGVLEISINAEGKYVPKVITGWRLVSNVQLGSSGGYYFLGAKDSAAANTAVVANVDESGNLTEGITLDPSKITDTNLLEYFMMDKAQEIFFPVTDTGSNKKLVEVKSSDQKTYDSIFDVKNGMPENPTGIDSMIYVGDHFDLAITSGGIGNIYSVSTSDQTASSNTALIVLGAVFGSLAVVGIAGGVGYYFYSKKNTKGGNKKPSIPAGDKPATPASKPESK